MQIISFSEMVQDVVVQNGENNATASGWYGVESCHKTHTDVQTVHLFVISSSIPKTSYFLYIVPLANSYLTTVLCQPLKSHLIPYRFILYALYILIITNLHDKGRSGKGIPILHKKFIHAVMNIYTC